MRLFIALQFDDDIIEELEYFQGMLKDEGVTGNFTNRENLHLTLAFIGDYNDPDEVLDVMEAVNFSPIEISLGGVGFLIPTSHSSESLIIRKAMSSLYGMHPKAP